MTSMLVKTLRNFALFLCLSTCRHVWLIIPGTTYPSLRHTSSKWAEKKGEDGEESAHSSDRGWWRSCSSLPLSSPYQSSPTDGWFSTSPLQSTTMASLLPHQNPISHRFVRKVVAGRKTPPWHCGVQTHLTAGFLERGFFSCRWALGVQTQVSAGYLAKDLTHSKSARGVQTPCTVGFPAKGLLHS